MADTEDRGLGDTKPEAPQATTADDKTEHPPATTATGDDIEASLDAEMQTADNDDSSQTKTLAGSSMNLDGATDDPPAVPQIETRMPAKKDVALRDFLGKMDEYAPIVRSCLHCAAAVLSH